MHGAAIEGRTVNLNIIELTVKCSTRVRGAGAVEDNLHLIQFAVHDFQSVHQPGHGHHRGAVLVVMEHRDIQRLLQPLFDFKTARRRDILQINAAEGR